MKRKGKGKMEIKRVIRNGGADGGRGRRKRRWGWGKKKKRRNGS